MSHIGAEQPVTADHDRHDTVAQTQGQIRDLDLRIVRQQRRLEKVILEQVGPRDEMEALLADMLNVRDALEDVLDSLVKERRAQISGVSPSVEPINPSTL